MNLHVLVCSSRKLHGPVSGRGCGGESGGQMWKVEAIAVDDRSNNSTHGGGSSSSS